MKSVAARILPKKGSVLDVGGADVNGSYKPIFAGYKYTSLDWHAADVVVSGYDWPVSPNSFDVVISGQALEHDGRFWLTLQNMAAVTKPGGHIVIIVPSKGAEHRHPIDCYRFYPDAMAVFAEIMQVDLVEATINKDCYWGDVVGVFQKRVSTRTPK